METLNSTKLAIEEFLSKPDLLERIINHPNFKTVAFTSLVTGGTVFVAYKLYSNYSRKLNNNQKNLEKEVIKVIEPKDGEEKKIAVDTVFLSRLWKILKICIPGVGTKEFEYFIILSILLLSRTLLTVEIAEMLGNNAQFLVSRNYYDLLIGVAK